jgi:hypothetical protein
MRSNPIAVPTEVVPITIGIPPEEGESVGCNQRPSLISIHFFKKKLDVKLSLSFKIVGGQSSQSMMFQVLLLLKFTKHFHLACKDVSEQNCQK